MIGFHGQMKNVQIVGSSVEKKTIENDKSMT